MMLALKCTLPVIYINKVFFLLVFIYFHNALNGLLKACAIVRFVTGPLNRNGVGVPGSGD